MQSFEFPDACSECKGPVVDAGDELVCEKCGMVTEKQVVEYGQKGLAKVAGESPERLGGFMGSAGVFSKEKFSRGFSKSNSTYTYLKTISDFAGREESSTYDCERMTRRVAEKYSLPEVVVQQGLEFSKKILSQRVRARGTTLAAISAYGLIAACKVEGVTSVSVKDIVSAYTVLGRRVTASSLIQLSLASPIKTRPRRPEEYLGRVFAKLSQNPRLVRLLREEGVGWTPYSSSLRDEAIRLLSLAPEESQEGHRPSTLAATAVYAAELNLASSESRRKRISQKDLAQCGDSAEYTLREQYRKIFSPFVNLLQAQKVLLTS